MGWVSRQGGNSLNNLPKEHHEDNRTKCDLTAERDKDWQEREEYPTGHKC